MNEELTRTFFDEDLRERARPFPSVLWAARPRTRPLFGAPCSAVPATVTDLTMKRDAVAHKSRNTDVIKIQLVLHV